DFGVSFDNGLVMADVDALRARGVNVDSLSAALALQAGRMPGVAAAYTPATLAAAPDSAPGVHQWRRLLPAGFGWLACATTLPRYVWSGGTLGAEHGAATAEDLAVPIAFLGPGIPAQHISRPARTVDIAPTLAA